jgi:TrmH family RNA methyltransferase
MRIYSIYNTTIKLLLNIKNKSKERFLKKLFLVEGKKEIKKALKGGYILKKIFLCDDFFFSKKYLKFFKKKEITKISFKVFKKLAYRDNVDGIIGLFKIKYTSLKLLKISPCPIFFILEGIEKPGNLGAILRISSALGIDAVILCDSKVDFFNPNVIRSSVGYIFLNQIVKTSSKSVIKWIKKEKIIILLATPKKNSNNIYKKNFRLSDPVAIVFGTESNGISKIWFNEFNNNIQIPIKKTVDSLNLSSAAAIIGFEILRQRYFI